LHVAYCAIFFTYLQSSRNYGKIMKIPVSDLPKTAKKCKFIHKQKYKYTKKTTNREEK